MTSLRLALLAGACCLAVAAPAAGKDYASTALNIIPSGQYGAISPPPGADAQAKMYDGLTPLFGSVTTADLTKYFKSEALNDLGTDGPGTNEAVPRPGLTIVRDKFNVPHITGATRDDATFGAGWIMAEDRGLLLSVALGPARVAAVDAPGLDAFGLVRTLRSFTPTQQSEDFLAKQTALLQAAGPKGVQLLHDIDVYLEGINAYRAANNVTPPITRNDIYAANALLAQFLGQGGGDEARRSQLLSGLRKRLGSKGGLAVFNDLRERNDPETPFTDEGRRFPYGAVPRNATGNVVLDNNSLTAAARIDAAARNDDRQLASNILMAAGSRSKTGHPLFVGGPQIGYFYPGLTLEMDVSAPGEHWRGATSVPFPGYLLIGRGEDFAFTLTSAGNDIIDQFAETLCGGDDFHYVFKGKCRAMGTFDAGLLKGTGSTPDREVIFRTTVHGPVAGYATSHGRRVAIANMRSSRGREALFQLTFQDISVGRVHDVPSFYSAIGQSPLTFNGFYADDEHVAHYSAGRLPIRARGVDPGLPTEGTGAHEWQGFLPVADHPHASDPRSGVLTNWNNRTAPGFQAADNTFGYGPVMRDQLLRRGMARRSKHDLASVTSAMNRAATQDVRAMEALLSLNDALSVGTPPSDRDAKMLELMLDWRRQGGSRLDKDLDGFIDHPGAAIMDAAWNGLADAVMTPVLGQTLADQLATVFTRFSRPPSGQFDGWMGYMSKDLRTLLNQNVTGPFSRAYCGKGNPAKCAKSLWAAIHAAGDTLTAQQGTPDPTLWRVLATPERIHFGPIDLFPMRYTNRPSGIQQVIGFSGHR